MIGVWLSTAATPLPSQTLAPTDPGLRLEVDLSERMLYVHQGGEVIQRYEVAVGTPEHPTPRGQFTIEKVIWDPAWVPPPNAEWAEDAERKAPEDPDNPMEAVKIFFEQPDYYIHGTDALQSLGSAASHGCIRMAPSDAEKIARLVMEHGGEPRDPMWYDLVIAQDDQTREITLPEPVMFAVRE